MQATPPRPPDHLVDPNLLAPTKPKPKPPATEVVVVCKLCGTRMYAPLAKIGQTVRCHDCHTENPIKAPVDPTAGKRAAAQSTQPTLDDVEEFGLSDVSERPVYRPLVAARGDDAILAALEPPPPGFASPDGGRADAITSSATKSVPHSADDDDDGGAEVTLSAPVERIEIKPMVLTPTIHIEADPNAHLYDGRYDNDRLIGPGNFDRQTKDAWKKAPFLLGLVEFLFYPAALARWILYGLGLGVVLIVIQLAFALTFSNDPGAQLAAIFIDGFAGLATGLWLAPFAASLLAILEDTGNGMVEVENWPDWGIGDWFVKAFRVVVAAFVSGLPGIFTAVLLVSGGVTPLVAPLPVVASWTLLFPVVMYSSLVEDSLLAVYSIKTGQSIHRASEAWMLFYLYSVGLAIFGGAFATLALMPYFLTNMLGGAGLVTVAFIYCRVLGRLMWYCEEKATRLPETH
jgi:hypothetical protein